MRNTIIRVLSATALGLACTMAGAYLGVNHAYDQFSAGLPEIIADAGCTPHL